MCSSKKSFKDKLFALSEFTSSKRQKEVQVETSVEGRNLSPRDKYGNNKVSVFFSQQGEGSYAIHGLRL